MGAHTHGRHRTARLRASVALAVAVWVAAMAVAPAAAVALPSISANHFASARTCICHNEQLMNWQRSMHAKALYDPVYVYEKSLAMKSDKAIGEFCDTCHTPIGTMAGQTSPGETLSRQSQEGVTCDFCHQVTGSAQPPGNANQTLKANGTKRAQFKDASAPSHKNAYSKFHTKAAFCGACHSLKHPATGVVLDSTYSDYLAGPFAALGVVCQDCHMSLAPMGGPASGRAASLGPIRSYIYQMNFVAANVPLGNAPLAKEILRSAARVSIEAPEVLEDGAAGTVRVVVSNVGCGHKIPGGVSEIRQMWLDVNLVAADGTKTLLGTEKFGTVLSDSAGNSPADLWEAASIESDTRIPPGGSSQASYEVRMDAAESLTIEAVLNYRSFPDSLAKKAGVKNPVTEMARASKAVYASARAQRKAERAGGSIVFPWCAAAAGVTLLGLAALFIARRVRRSRRADAAQYGPAAQSYPDRTSQDKL